MFFRNIFELTVLTVLTANAQTINIHGTVSTSTGKPIVNATVSLVGQKLRATTMTDGVYSITKTRLVEFRASRSQAAEVSLHSGIMEFGLTEPSLVKIEIYDVRGNLLEKVFKQDVLTGAYQLNVIYNSLAVKMLIIRVTVANQRVIFHCFPLSNGSFMENQSASIVSAKLMKTSAVIIDTIKVAAIGYLTKSLPIYSLDTMVNVALDTNISNNKFYTLLTGGTEVAYKIWKIDSADGALANGGPSVKDSLGNGTSNWNDTIKCWWYSLLAGSAYEPPSPPPRALDDEYIFGLYGFTYKNDCHGDFYFNWAWANRLFGLHQAQYHDTICAYTPDDPAEWSLDVDTITPEDSSRGRLRFFLDSVTGKRFNLIITLSKNNFLGYCSGVSVYEILKITQDTMFLRHELDDPARPSLSGQDRMEWRYLRLVAKK
jgi:hypothetical protein